MSETDVTVLLKKAHGGDASAREDLYAQVYDELRRLARGKMRQERDGHTLQPTALVNEAFLRLIQGEPEWDSRAHFFGAAAEAMRRILVEHARKRARLKRGGDAQRVTFDELAIQAEEPDLDVLVLDDALTALAAADARLARLVQLRYFAGLSIKATAEVLGVSAATVKRDWTYARAWLYERMTER